MSFLGRKFDTIESERIRKKKEFEETIDYIAEQSAYFFLDDVAGDSLEKYVDWQINSVQSFHALVIIEAVFYSSGNVEEWVDICLDDIPNMTKKLIETHIKPKVLKKAKQKVIRIKNKEAYAKMIDAYDKELKQSSLYTN